MARTVADAAAVLQAIAGYDPNDTATAVMKGRTIPDYLASLKPGALKGARIGILRQAYERPSLDSEVNTVFIRAVRDLRRAGATVLDTVLVPQLDSIQRSGRGGRGTSGCNPFKYEFNQWLAEQGGRAPIKSLDDVVRTGRYHPSIEGRLRSADTVSLPPDSIPSCLARGRVRTGLRAAVTAIMDSLHLDALVYPTWSNPPRLIGDLNTPGGDNSQVFSPTTGMPAITVPMGYTRNNTLPAGMTIYGRAFDEPRLIALAYGYEQATKWRREPASTPPLAATSHNK
jgi:Asp-tRNA(Asn)/Glu-tRNA(Gln) amidotransferase A subunit family amidase